MVSLNLIAPVSDLGYGIHARGIIKGLSELGHDNYYLSLIGERNGELSQEEISITNKLVSNPWNRSSPCVKIWHEFQMTDLSGSKLIAYPVWETTKLIPKAIHELKQMDAVFVTTSWAKQVLIDNIGEDVPVFVVNEAGQDFGYSHTPEKYPVFTFSHVGKFEYRKCTLEMIQSYVEAFHDKEDTRFVLHCFNTFDPNFVKTVVNALTRLGLQFLPTATDASKMVALKGNAVVEIPKTKLKKKDIYELYKRSHVGVYPSRAEGWNLGLFESITHGLPCVASFVSGHTEYTTEDLGYPQELLLKNGKLVPAYDGVWFRGDRGDWTDPDFSELKDKMLYAYNQYNDIMNNYDVSKIKERFNWKNSAKQLITALNTITGEE